MTIRSTLITKTLLVLAFMLTALTHEVFAQGRASSNAGVTSGESSTAGSDVEDTLLGTRVKAALLADPEIDDTDIAVDVQQGRVILEGNVANREQHARALEVARGIEGVRTVQNRLSIGN